MAAPHRREVLLLIAQFLQEEGLAGTLQEWVQQSSPIPPAPPLAASPRRSAQRAPQV